MSRHLIPTQASCKIHVAEEICMLCLPWALQVSMQQLIKRGLWSLLTCKAPPSLLSCSRLF